MMGATQIILKIGKSGKMYNFIKKLQIFDNSDINCLKKSTKCFIIIELTLKLKFHEI